MPANRHTSIFAFTFAKFSPTFDRARALMIASALAFIILSCIGRTRAEAGDPSIEWKQIETDHFVIVFDSRHYPLAANYAKAAEQAFKTTAPVFTIWPRKTVILLDDETDMANGSATGIPYPTITLFPVLPTALDSIGDYGNWGVELITHEYTHVLTFEPATGIMRPLRWVFGSVVRPNILLPRWYSEGIAVELETRLSNYGRLRSSNYLSIVRAMVEDESLDNETIGRINETIPDWPGGIRPYLFGALLWDEMIREKGDSIVPELNLTYSRRIPYLIDGPIEDRFGFGYGNLLNRVFNRSYENANRQLDLIRAKGTTPMTPVQQTGYFNHTPVISPDGKHLLFIGREHNVESSINLLSRDDIKTSFTKTKSEQITTGLNITRLSWLPDSSGFIYNSIAAHDRYYQFSDLWKYNLATKEASQLTRGARAREAVVSPDGRSIVFVQNTPGGTRLATSRIDGTQIRVLHEPGLQVRISTPEFLSANEIILSERTATGDEVFKVFALERSNEGDFTVRGDARVILGDFKPVHFPRMTKAGLIFVSDRSGVANLYQASRDLKRARAITNSTTRVMTGEIDASTHELYFSSLKSSGPQIVSVPSQAWTKTPTEPPRVGPLVDSQFPEYKTPEVDVKPEAESYNPLPWLVPRYWMPYAWINPDSLFFSASTNASDPTGRHAYRFDVSYDTLVKQPSFSFRYENATTPFLTGLQLDDVRDYLYASGNNRRSKSGTLAAISFIPTLPNTYTAGLGLHFSETDAGTSTFSRGGVLINATWTNAAKRGLEISPEKGGYVSIQQTKFIRGLGANEYDQTDLNVSWYFSKWLPSRHALMLSTSVFYAPDLPSILYGRTTRGGNYTTALSQTFVVMRGYSSGTFIGRSLIKSTAEYRFPLTYTYQGAGTLPFFIQRFHGAVFADALTLDGAAYDYSGRSYYRQSLGEFSIGTGVEARADATVFYHLPVQFIFGLYWGANPRSNPLGVFPFIGIGM